jgi:hypothetical protein
MGACRQRVDLELAKPDGGPSILDFQRDRVHPITHTTF